MTSYNFANYGTVKVNGTALSAARLNGTTFWVAGAKSATIGSVTMTTRQAGTWNYDYSHTFSKQLIAGTVRLRNFITDDLSFSIQSGYIHSTYKLYNGNTLLKTVTHDHNYHGGTPDAYWVDQSFSVSMPVTRIWYRHRISRGGSMLGWRGISTVTNSTSRFEFTVT